MLLMAHALGLGSIYVNFDKLEHEELIKRVQKLLEVPKGVRIMAILLAGFSNEQSTPPPRREMDEIVFYERHGRKAEKE